MWLDAASRDALEWFWRQCGEVEPFPRNLERPLALGLPVVLAKMPRLRLWDIERWFRQRTVGYLFNCESRGVRGCLIAYGAHGFIFVDGSDGADEQRFTLAHEIAHFLLDYWLPRLRAIEKLGPAISEVLDGRRAATVSERLYALLGDAPVGLQLDLLERGDSMDSDVWRIEDRADRLALALLAPVDEVLPVTDLSAGQYAQRLKAMAGALRERFGLPPAAARAYARGLLEDAGKGPSWVEALRSSR